MSNSGSFEHDHAVVRYAATQLPNLPHIQSHLRRIADGLEHAAKEAEQGLIAGVAKLAGAGLGESE